MKLSRIIETSQKPMELLRNQADHEESKEINQNQRNQQEIDLIKQLSSESTRAQGY